MIGEPPTMGMLHPPDPQDPPERAVPGKSGKARSASATRPNSASLRMAGSLQIRESAKGQVVPVANASAIGNVFRMTADTVCGMCRPARCFIESARRTIAKPFAAKKSKITIQGRCTIYKELKQNLQCNHENTKERKHETDKNLSIKTSAHSKWFILSWFHTFVIS
jgi:hypothetical protein